MAKTVCTGVVIPLITPFDEDFQIDFPTLDSLVEFTVSRGVHGLFVAGSAGMGPVMSVEQRKAVCESVVRKVARRVPVIVMVGAADTPTTVELGEHAKKVGADAIASLAPYYYSDHTDNEILYHFKKLGDAVNLPTYIYENSRYTGITIKPPLARKIVETTPSICGIKVSHGTLEEVLRYVDALPKETGVFSGPILNLFPGYYFGIKGSVSPPTSMVPELAVSFWNAVVERRYEESIKQAGRILSVVSVLMGSGTNKLRPYLETVARMRGLPIKRYPRWETDRLTQKEISDLQLILENVGLSPKMVA
ncbi:MAG: dihydrodipicolinate synthase family protein [Thaumarchaeota archaeon]|nr:dihydrodipicolinate synthase family protein [Nitrososphaerota archaeon]